MASEVGVGIEHPNNVISLSERDLGPGADFVASKQLPPLVLEIRDRVRQQLVEQVKLVLARTDDSLFAMVEKVQDQEEHNGLFQALRLLRIERQNLIVTFEAQIDSAFLVQEASQENSIEPTAVDELTLMENDALEQLVTVDTMVANAKSEFGEALQVVSQRLNTLFAVKIHDANNPLGPDVICDAFIVTLHPLKLHIRARLTLLKKFEQLVMLRLKALYDNCNQLLIDRGVLSSLRDQRRVLRQPQSTPQHTDSLSNVQPAADATAGFHHQELLLQGTAPIQVNELLTYLNRLQSSVPQRLIDGEVQLLNINKLLQEQLVQANKSASLAKVDNDAIKLVEMLFSFILEDRNLAEPIKTQLGRLQLPLLKVAIADKSFFSKGGHPARKLLNELAEASTGWQPSENYEKDPLYTKISQVVAQILTDFEQDLTIFSMLLESFQQFVASEHLRARKLERRTVDEAGGRARIEAARTRVAAIINALIFDRELPSIIDDWLEKVWNQLLFLSYIKDGSDSEAWSQNLRTLRELIWSVQTPLPEQRQQLAKQLPELQTRLRAAVEMVSLNPFDARGLFAGLTEVYHRHFEQPQQADKKRPEPEYLTGSDVGQQACELEPAAEPKAEIIPAPLPELPKVGALEQMAVNVKPQREGLEPMSESNRHWQQTFRLAHGSWFEFKRSDSEELRCRLAAIIRETDQFIFVNRNGAKVVEFNRLELAQALRQAQLMPLDEGMLFERALRSVVGHLRQQRQEQP
ncbi:MAG: DUF1631 domain-containing protein [Gammaproteobacteria bacterium]|nr:DUF1631 domain-containing protein [Gammaproteobacteria bacterium]